MKHSFALLALITFSVCAAAQEPLANLTATATTNQVTEVTMKFDAPTDPQLAGVFFEVHTSKAVILHHALPLSLRGGDFVIRIGGLVGLEIITIYARSIDLDGNVSPVTESTPEVQLLINTNRPHLIR